MAKDKLDQIKALVKIGKKRGFLTYAEINEALPENVVSANQIDDVLAVFDEMDISIVEKKKDFKASKAGKKTAKTTKKKKAADEEKEKASSSDAFGKSSDPVRLYLRKMGSVALLTREGEVEIAKRIESHEDDVLLTLITSTFGMDEIFSISESLKKGKIRLTLVVKDYDDLAQSEDFDEEAYREDVLKLFQKFKSATREFLRIQKKAKSSGMTKKAKEKVEKNLEESRQKLLMAVKEIRFNRKACLDCVPFDGGRSFLPASGGQVRLPR